MWRSFARPDLRCRAAREPTAATPRRTIRACWSASANPRKRRRVRVRWPDGRTEEWTERGHRSLHDPDSGRSKMMSRRALLHAMRTGRRRRRARWRGSLFTRGRWRGTGAGRSPRGAAVRGGSPSESGITWVHDNAMSAEHYLPETIGPGCAFLDYDNDGWMDIYLVNSGPSDFFTPTTPLRNALYKNNRDGTFTDVTEKAGVAGGTFGMGVAVGDYDNDGYPDLFVTAYGRCILYHNNGDGTFTDVTATGRPRRDARLDDRAPCGSTTTTMAGSTCSCAASWSSALDRTVFCGDNKLGRQLLLHPARLQAHRRACSSTTTATERSREVSAGTDIETALRQSARRGRDRHQQRRADGPVRRERHRPELPVRQSRRRASGKRSALPSEVGFSANGQPRSGMGVDAADFDRRRLPGLFVANVDQEMFSLYRRTAARDVPRRGARHGVAQATRLLSGWGLKFFDYDNDGHVDLFLANGHPDDMIDRYSAPVTLQGAAAPVPQRGGRLRNVSAAAGPGLREDVSRARPGSGGFQQRRARRRPRRQQRRARRCCCEQRAAPGNHWLGLKLRGRRVQPRRHRRADLTWSAGGVRRGAAEDLRRQLSLVARSARGPRHRRRSRKIDWLEIQWPAPSTKTERFTNVPVDRYVTIVEGKGIQR